MPLTAHHDRATVCVNLSAGSTKLPGRKLVNFGERAAEVEIVKVEEVERVETVEAIDEVTAKRRAADQAYCFA